WSRDHPRVVTRHESVPSSQGEPAAPVELDMLDVVDGFLSNALSAGQGRSEPLRRLAADSLVARLSRTSTTKERRRPPRWVAHRFEGDDDYLLLVLRGLRSAPLDDDTLLDVADVLTAPRPGYPARAPAV